MRPQPSPATFGALRATRDAHRLATAILRERITTLATVECASCRRPIAVATDAAHPAAAFEGRVLCPSCVRAPRVKEALAWGLYAEPPIQVCMEDVEQWLSEGWIVHLPTEPDPRPTLGEWLRRLFRPGARRRGETTGRPPDPT